jgi:flavin-dependent dehydrogenase
MSGVFRNESFASLAQNKESLKVETSSSVSKYKYLVAADGAESSVRNCLGIKKGTIKTLVQYVLDEESQDHNTLELFHDEKYQGDHKWVFPNGSSVKVGFRFCAR